MCWGGAGVVGGFGWGGCVFDRSGQQFLRVEKRCIMGNDLSTLPVIADLC